jgi:hypothetical protein
VSSKTQEKAPLIRLTHFENARWNCAIVSLTNKGMEAVQDAHVRCVCIQLRTEHALMPTRGEVELHQPVVRPISCYVTPSIPPLMEWQTEDILEALRV